MRGGDVGKSHKRMKITPVRYELSVSAEEKVNDICFNVIGNILWELQGQLKYPVQNSIFLLL